MLELVDNKVKLPKDEEIRDIISKVLNNTNLIHPYSRPYEMVSLAEFKIIILSIKVNGLKVKIVRAIDHKDKKLKILDGKQRYIGCKIAGVEAEFEDKEDLSEVEQVMEVITLNENRRHDTLARRLKRAYYYYKLLKKLIIKENNSSTPEKTISTPEKNTKTVQHSPAIQNKVNVVKKKEIRNQLAKVIHSKPETIEQGIKILDKAQVSPEAKKLWNEVEKGRKSVKAAYQESLGQEKAKAKPPEIDTQKEINITLRKEIIQLEKENRNLQSKLILIKDVVESDITKNKMRVEILEIIDIGNTKEEEDILPIFTGVNEFKTIKTFSKS